MIPRIGFAPFAAAWRRLILRPWKLGTFRASVGCFGTPGEVSDRRQEGVGLALRSKVFKAPQTAGPAN